MFLRMKLRALKASPKRLLAGGNTGTVGGRSTRLSHGKEGGGDVGGEGQCFSRHLLRRRSRCCRQDGRRDRPSGAFCCSLLYPCRLSFPVSPSGSFPPLIIFYSLFRPFSCSPVCSYSPHLFLRAEHCRTADCPEGVSHPPLHVHSRFGPWEVPSVRVHGGGRGQVVEWVWVQSLLFMPPSYFLVLGK